VVKKIDYGKHGRKITLRLLNSGKFSVTVDSLPEYFIDHKGSHREFNDIENATQCYEHNCLYYKK